MVGHRGSLGPGPILPRYANARGGNGSDRGR